MKQVFHEDFLGEDIPRIGNPPNGAPLGRSLALYRKKIFHSVLSPLRGMRADYRLVYRCDFEKDELIVLGVGRRIPGHPDDIYSILAVRSPI